MVTATRRLWESKNREKLKAAKAKWQRDHKNRVNSLNRKWKSKNKEKVKAGHVKYKTDHKGQIKTWHAENYLKNREKILARNKRYYLKNKVKYRQTCFKYRLRTEYGMTLDEWNALFIKQGQCCAICGSKVPNGKSWGTDHDHETGKVRGILCFKCNAGLGIFNDNTTVLRLAADYLERQRGQ